MFDSMTKESIEGGVTTRFFGKQVLYYEEADSTNSLAKQLGEDGGSHGLLVVADSQSAGRGRRGRTWLSPKGCGIWMTLLLRPELEPVYASKLTLLAALSVVRAIEENTGLRAKIKWPNDIVVNEKKVCGILTEMSATADAIHYVVIGIGINVNTPDFPKELEEIATSLYCELGKSVKREPLLCDIMKYMEQYYNRFCEEKGMNSFLSEYNSCLINRERVVKISGKQELVGIAKGINENGELLVDVEGTMVPVLSGEVSVRGLYGYV